MSLLVKCIPLQQNDLQDWDKAQSLIKQDMKVFTFDRTTKTEGSVQEAGNLT